MRKLSPRSFQVCCTIFFLLLLITSISFSQIVIRDTVVIAPKEKPLQPATVLTTTPMVEVSFSVIDGSMPAGAIVSVGIGDTTWTMSAAGNNRK